MNIQPGIDYLSESIALLTLMGKNEPVKKIIDSRLLKESADPKAFYEEQKPVLDFLFSIEKEFQKTMKSEKALLDFYFGSSCDEEHWDNVGRVLLLWEEFTHTDTGDFEAYKTALYEMEELQYYIEFATKLQYFNDSFRAYGTAQKISSKEDALRFILHSDFSEREKLLFSELLVNYKSHLEQCFTLMKKTIALLQTHESEILQLYERFHEYWSRCFAGQDPVAYFRENNESLKDAIPENPLGHIITIELFHPFMCGFNMEKDDKTEDFLSPYILPIGILYCDSCPLRYTKDNKEGINLTAFYLEALKQISHKNRFEILCHVKDQTATGSELAELLQLTNATVSHHTGLLHKNELVTMTPNGTQLLIRSNKNTISECIQFLRQELL